MNGNQTGYLFDGENFVQELLGGTSASGIRANLITGGIDETFSRRNVGASRTEHLLSDGNQNTIALAQDDQSLATRYRYTPYGQTTQTGTVSSNTQQYTGRENDGTGLMYYWARYYMPSCGRFISEDPIGWASGQNNPYAYVGGDPVGFVDPYGLWSAGSAAKAAFKAYGAYNAFMGACETAQTYLAMNDKTQAKFDQRESNPDLYTPSQRKAEVAEMFSNFMGAYGEPVAKTLTGIGMMSVRGGGAGFAMGTAVSVAGSVYGGFGGQCY